MSEPTAADRLRAAAEKLRGLAEGATPGPLVAITDNGRKDGIAILGAVTNRGTGQAIALYAATNGRRHSDARLAATLDGRVALALAAVFEQWAFVVDVDPDLLHRLGGPETLNLARLIMEAT